MHPLPSGHGRGAQARGAESLRNGLGRAGALPVGPHDG